MRRLTVLMTMGLLAACSGQSASNLSNDVENSMNVLEGNVVLDNTAALALGIGVENAANNQAEPGNVIVGGLPLRLGFYVANDAECATASNATLTIMRRDGYSGSRYSCTFGAIEKTGETSYRVTESCTERGGLGGSAEARTSVRNYEVTDVENFSAKSDSGWESNARFCPQSTLPEPWRDNDISDVTG